MILICCRNGNGQHGHVGITQWKITRVFSEHDEALINRWCENVFAMDVYKGTRDQNLISLSTVNYVSAKDAYKDSDFVIPLILKLSEICIRQEFYEHISPLLSGDCQRNCC